MSLYPEGIAANSRAVERSDTPGSDRIAIFDPGGVAAYLASKPVPAPFDSIPANSRASRLWTTDHLVLGNDRERTTSVSATRSPRRCRCSASAMLTIPGAQHRRLQQSTHITISRSRL